MTKKEKALRLRVLSQYAPDVLASMLVELESSKDDLRAEFLNELREAKADALESLNNQAEAIRELQARAVPEGWEFVTIAKWAPKKGQAKVGSAVVKRNYVEEVWTWRVESRDGKFLRQGKSKSFNDAVQQAEKAGKKVKR